MADPKNVIIDIKNGLADVRQQMNLVKQETAGWVSSLGSGVSRLSGVGGGSGGGGVSSTLVAPNPKFTPPASMSGGGPQGGALVPGGGSGGGGGGGNVVAYTPSASGGGGSGYTGNTNLTNYVTNNPTAGFLYAAAVTGGMVDQPGESVEAQLLMSRVGYFNKQSMRAGTNTVAMGPNAYNDINRLQANLAGQATTKDKMDVMRGLAAAQSIGVTGANITQASGGMSSVAGGVAAVSNLLPGAGFEGSMRAFSSMQQGRNVNMLRGIGIQLRDQQGNMKPPDQIIDDIWKKICRDYAGAYGSGKVPSKQEVLIGLQPGNSMDAMLDLYFGNDPMAKQIVANGLIYKAETGGGAISKAKLTELGGTTVAVNAQSARNAAQARQTGLTANAGAEGYTTAANAITAFSKFMTDKALPILEGITQTNALIVTLLGAANDTGAKGLGLLAAAGGKPAALAGIIATGGLGLGIGTVLAPGLTSSLFSGKGVGTSDAERDKFAIEVLKGIGAKPTKENIEAMQIWMNREGGSTRNSATYNYLNTSQQMPGSVNYQTKQEGKGVQAYNSFEEGVQATIKTFKGPNAKTYKYDTVIDLLQKGAPKEDIFAALEKSSWDAGRYKGTNWSNISPDYKGGNTGLPGSSSNTTNNTNVTINVTGTNKDPNAIAQEIERILSQQATRNKAANK
jgi:hypothetical protein